MRSEKEMRELSEAVSKAVFAYHRAIFDNLEESGKEHGVYAEDEADGGLALTIIDDNGDSRSVVVDKVRYTSLAGAEDVEVHICEYNYNPCSRWESISSLGDAQDYVCDNIIWE